MRYGQTVGTLSQVVDVTNPTTTTATIQGLTLGTWYFTVASYNNTGVESAFGQAALHRHALLVA